MLGKIPFSQALICLVSIVNFCGVFFSGGLLIYHGQLLLANQTVSERNKHFTNYDTGSKIENIKESLGRNWYLTFVSPLLPSPLLSDGIYYTARPVDYKPPQQQQQYSNKNK